MVALATAHLVVERGSGGAATDTGRQGNGTPATSARFVPCAPGARTNCVIDGDTIRHRGITIRLADIDAPEISEPRCSSEQALGHRAKARLLDLVNQGPIRLVSAGGRDEDIYGRRLRIVEQGGRSVGDMLIAEGLARRWDGARRSWCG